MTKFRWWSSTGQEIVPDVIEVTGDPATEVASSGELRVDASDVFDDIIAATSLSSLDTDDLIVGGSPWVDVRSFGAIGDGSVDDTSAIQAAIDSLVATGGSVLFPVGTYKVTDTLIIEDNDIILRGTSYEPRINGGAFAGRGARIIWQGTVDDGPIVLIAPNSTGTGLLEGCGINTLVLDGNQRASIGLQILSSRMCNFVNVHVHECRTASFDLGPLSNDYDVSDSRVCSKNTFHNISTFNFGADGTGLRLRGTTNFASGGENTYGCNFHSLQIRVTDGSAAIDVMDADDCNFFGVFIGTPGTAHAIELRGHDGANQKSGARNCFFYGVYPNTGGIYSRAGSGGTSARNNSIWGLSYEDGTEPEVTVESGSTLSYYDSRAGGVLRINNRVVNRTDILTAAEGLKYQNFSRAAGGASSILTSGRIEYVLIPVAEGDVITNLYVCVTVVGASQTLSKMGLYDSSANRLAVTADLGTTWTASTGVVACPLTSPYTVTATGGIYIAMLSVGGTQPTLLRGSNNGATNTAVSGALKPMATQSSQTDLPNPGSLSGSSGAGWFVAWS